MLAPRLGVDFGTSNTVAVLQRGDGPGTPLLFDSSPLLASGIFAGPDGVVLTGADAARAAAGFPAGFEPNPKRRIDEATVWLGERELAVVDTIAAVLGRINAEALRVAGGPLAAVTLTHPAAWGATRLGTLAEAARRAGWAQVAFVAEPVAAAAYFVDVLDRDLPADRRLVVYDMGAGTFDISVVHRVAAGFEVIASDGLDDVGGLDLDAAVIAYLRTLTAGAADAWGRLDWPQTPDDQRARRTLWADARAVKEQLSRHPAADLHVPVLDIALHLTRDELEKVIRPLLERTVALTLSTLRGSGTPPESLAGVFLVGGSSRVPLAANLLHRTLGIAPTVLDHPELVVAHGGLRTEGRMRGATPAGASASFLPAAPPPAAPAVGPRPDEFAWTPAVSAAVASAADRDLLSVAAVDISLPHAVGLTLRHYRPTLDGTGASTEVPVFLAVGGRLQVFGDDAQLVRFLHGEVSHDLAGLPGWPGLVRSLGTADLVPDDADFYRLDLVLGNLGAGSDAWDPDLLISAGEIARDLGYALRLPDVLAALAPGSALDELDEVLRAGGRRMRRRLRQFVPADLVNGWHSVIYRLSTAVDHHPAP